MLDTQADEAGFRVVNKGDRAADIKARRLALGLGSIRAFAQVLHDEIGMSRDAVTAAERGTATATTYDRIEAWLSRQEEENGHDAPPPVEKLQVTLKVGRAEFLVQAGSPAELAEAVDAILERMGHPEQGHPGG